jgi:SAM-dependent methyltransferase
MDRTERLLAGITKEQKGIEIGPWFNPVAPKSEGFNCMSLDVFDTETLRSRAERDPNISADMAAKIEDVDLVGSSVDIAALASKHGCLGDIDYIVSSHNLEHIPDPIRFLQGCAQTLKPGGVLSLAVPDKRACFDHYRPHSTLGDWLEAYFEGRRQPTPKQTFDGLQLGSRCHVDGLELGAFSIDADPSNIIPRNEIAQGFSFWQDRIRNGEDEYVDAHCWTLTPAVFELILLDLIQLSLLKLRPTAFYGPAGCEFYFQLRACPEQDQLPERDYFAKRTDLIERTREEQAVVTQVAWDAMRNLSVLQTENNALLERSSRQEKASAEEENLRLKGDNAALQRKLRDIESSTTWRRTASLRRVITAWRRFFS